MKKNLTKILIAIFILMSLVACKTEAEKKEVVETKEVADISKVDENMESKEILPMNDYGFKINKANKKILETLYKSPENENVVFSNAGVMAVFKMANKATGGNSKTEIDKFVGDFDKNLDSEAVNTYNFMTYNGLINDVKVKNSFIDELKNDKNIKADIYEINIETPAEKIANIINERIEKETNGQIKNGIDKNLYMDKSFVAQLGNVIHFKGLWALADETGYPTRNLHFENIDKSKVAAKFIMPHLNHADLIENENAIGFSLDYKEDDKRYKFVALLPKDDEIDFLKLDLENLKYYDESEYTLDVRFPKFEFDSDMNLTKIIEGLDVTDIFNPLKADFSNGFDGSIYVQSVNQKAVIRVDEFGTEASALTTMNMMKMSSMEEKMKKVRQVELTYNKPFIYMIYDSKNEMPLFIGAIKNLKDNGEEVLGSDFDTILDEEVMMVESTKTKGR